MRPVEVLGEKSNQICKYLNAKGSCECQIDSRKFQRPGLTSNENVADNGLEPRGGPSLPRQADSPIPAETRSRIAL